MVFGKGAHESMALPQLFGRLSQGLMHACCGFMVTLVMNEGMASHVASSGQGPPGEQGQTQMPTLSSAVARMHSSPNSQSAGLVQ